MHIGNRAVLAASLAVALLTVPGSLAAQANSAPAASTLRLREIYQALNDLRVDPTQIYVVSDLRLRRDAVSLTFSEGTIGLIEAYDGRVTGAVFSGLGHVSANPRDPAERQSLAHFLGVPLLDQNFSGAYLRFDDGSADEILDQLRHVGSGAKPDDEFAATWNKSLPNLNPGQSARLLLDWTAVTPAPFFYSELLDDRLGAFDVLVDRRRADSVLIGQERWVKGNRFYDMWASFEGSDTPAAAPAFTPVSYTIDTKINQDNSLEASAIVDLRVEHAGERGIELGLSRYLTMQSVKDDAGNALDFFQNDSLDDHQLAEQGSDDVLVFLPETARAGQTYRVHLTYRGNVISNAGNGVYFVGDRGSWYPRVGGMGQFAAFDMTFRWPRKLQLVATGEKVEEHEDGDLRVGHWRSDGVTPIAGFNLGDFKVVKMETMDGIKIQVAANSQLENALMERLRSQTPAGSAVPEQGRLNRRLITPPLVIEATPLPIAGQMREVGVEISDAIRFEQQWMGSFPFHDLVVSQLPGNVGQGFPGLLYLPALSFLPATTRQQSGMANNIQESLNAVVPFHEVAHQWWGNVVGWDNYRDQWLDEGLANYVALVGADSVRPGTHLLAHWLDQYRKALTAPAAGQQNTVDDAGPLAYGMRLDSSRDPDAYQKIIYGKGSWVFHMLRMMMQDPASKNPDERFITLLHTLVESHRHRALTTEDLQKAVEHAMTPAMAIEGGHSMDWFFDQYVRATGIPAYDVEYTVRPGPKGFLVKGTLTQKNVPDDFVLRVPVYGQGQSGKPVLLGDVVTSGEETSFQFASAISPKKLLIDPQMTVLCLPASSTSLSPE
jgi:Peptidase family M1 domain